MSSMNIKSEQRQTNTWNNRVHTPGKNEQHHLKMNEKKIKYVDRITSWKSKVWLKAVARGSKLDEYNEATESKRTCSTVCLDTWQSSFPVYWKWFFIRFMPSFRRIFEFEQLKNRTTVQKREKTWAKDMKMTE